MDWYTEQINTDAFFQRHSTIYQFDGQSIDLNEMRRDIANSMAPPLRISCVNGEIELASVDDWVGIKRGIISQEIIDKYGLIRLHRHDIRG